MSGRAQPDMNDVGGPHNGRRERLGLPKGAQITRICDVKPEPVAWLWQGRIPLGMLTVLDGDPGLGKSTVLLDLASRLSRGDAMPDCSPGPAPAGTVILSAEDDLSRVIRPRLEATGADLGIVATVHVRSTDGELREPRLSPADLVEVESAVREVGALLVIVDPLVAYLAQDVDAHRDQDVRRSLATLRGLAERTGAAAVVIRHLNKSQGENALYRGGGSIGIVAAARSGLLLAAEPNDASRERRVLASVKSNLAPAPPSLRLRLVRDAGAAFAHVSWEGECNYSAASLLAPPPSQEDRSAVDQAVDFLRDLLEAGPMRAVDVECEAKSAGLKVATLRRARERLGIAPRKTGRPGDAGQHWTWALPEDAQAPAERDAKMLNRAEREHVREGEPSASTCGRGASEDAQAVAREHVQRVPEVPSTPSGEHLRERGGANPVNITDVPEDAHEAAARTSSEPAAVPRICPYCGSDRILPWEFGDVCRGCRKIIPARDDVAQTTAAVKAAP